MQPDANPSHDDNVKDRRRNLRQRSTEAENLLWSAIRSRKLNGLKFRRQHSLGPFIVDFVCLESNVVVEVDGEYHDYQFEKDKCREEQLKAMGYRVLRLSNDDVMRDCEMACVAIRRFCEGTS